MGEARRYSILIVPNRLFLQFDTHIITAQMVNKKGQLIIITPS